MNLFAAATLTTAEKLQAIAPDFWFKLIISVVALVAAVVLLRHIAQMNKAVAGVVLLLVATFVGFSWIYERNEPRWATPAVSWISGFFPSKGAYVVKQQTQPLATPPVAAKRN